MTKLTILPFQPELREIALAVGALQRRVNTDSDLGEALDRILAIMDPFYGTVEWISPISDDETDFRAYLTGMKL